MNFLPELLIFSVMANHFCWLRSTAKSHMKNNLITLFSDFVFSGDDIYIYLF